MKTHQNQQRYKKSPQNPGSLNDSGTQAPQFAAAQTAATGLPPGHTLRSSVSAALSAYLSGVDEDFIRNFYDTVLAEVEPPMLAAVMHKARSNQSRAALMLGLNRGTLRKKLKQYNMLD